MKKPVLNTNFTKKKIKSIKISLNKKIMLKEKRIFNLSIKMEEQQKNVKKKINIQNKKFLNKTDKINVSIKLLDKKMRNKLNSISKKFESKIHSLKKLKKYDEKVEMLNNSKAISILESQKDFALRTKQLLNKKTLLKNRHESIIKNINFKLIYLKCEMQDTAKEIKDLKKLRLNFSEKTYTHDLKIVHKLKKQRSLIRVQQQTNKDYMKPILKVANKMSTQRHLMAIRNGVVMAMPLIIVGSIFLIVSQFPISSDPHATHKYLGDLMSQKWKDAFKIIFTMFMGVISIVVAFGVSSSLGGSYGLDKTTSGILGFVGFILWAFPTTLLKENAMPISATVASSLKDVYLASDAINFGAIAFSSLGSRGMFAAILSSLVIIELYRVTLKYKITIKLPSSVPQAVSNSFLILTPILFYGLFVFFFGYILGFDLIGGLNVIFKPIEGFLTGNIGGVMILVFLITLFWSVGLHGVAIFNAIVRPIWTKAILANSAAYINGLDIPNKYPEQFLQWTVWVGGAGATLGLVIITLFFAKSKQLKAVGKASIVPGIFNINEPVIFGYPIMLNILMIIPFILVPQLLVISSYIFQVFIFKYSWVAISPWTLPGPIGSFFAAGSYVGTQWAAPLVTIVNIGISMIVYYPFLKSYDRQLVKQEKENEAKEIQMIKEKLKKAI